MDSRRHSDSSRRRGSNRRHSSGDDEMKDGDRRESRREDVEPVRRRPRLEIADDDFPIEKREEGAKQMSPATQQKTRRMMGLFAAQLKKIQSQVENQKDLDEKREEVTKAAENEAKQRNVEQSQQDEQKMTEDAAKDEASVPAHDDSVVRCWRATDSLISRFRVTSGRKPIYWAPKDLLRKLANSQPSSEEPQNSEDGGDEAKQSDEGCGAELATLIEQDVKEGRVHRFFLSEDRPRTSRTGPDSPTSVADDDMQAESDESDDGDGDDNNTSDDDTKEGSDDETTATTEMTA